MINSSSEDDENKVYRAMLQSEVLDLNTEDTIIEEPELTKSLDPYSIMKYS